MNSINRYLNVLIYSDHFFPSIGGSENYVLELANELTKEGHKVCVVTSEKTGSEDVFTFQVRRLKKPLSIKRLNFNFIEFPAIVREFKPDLIHISYQTGGENLLLLFSNLFKVPIMLTYHGDHVTRVGRLIDKFQLITTFRLVDAIVVQTERDKKRMITSGIGCDKLHRYHFNGIYSEKYSCKDRKKPSTDPIKIITVSALDSSHKYKGMEFLIEALFNLQRKRQKLSSVQVSIVGDGDLRMYYQDLVSRRELDNVVFLGKLSDDELVQVYCKSDLLILPSSDKGEGFGRVVLEAISCGTDVIVSNKAGIAELLLKYDSGFVFEANNIRSFEEELFRYKKIVHNDYHGLQERKREMLRTEKLNLDESTKATVSIYRNTIESKN